ncbi:hypothetical protein VTN77DRAFT_383 [Rasamsonia byssochlamydoides]|uniref:uncharacterized protein n=1 Tax=Rasamsonia byssochlamydoides TaxID=89139 RepID=UPI003743536B
MFSKLILAIIFPIVLANAAPVDASVLSNTLTLVSSIRQADDFVISQCALNRSSPPLDESSLKLSVPSPGLSLKYVALGRGTQNYTCQSDNPTTVPTSNGAVATLFDASCLAAGYPALLRDLPPALMHVTHDAAVLAALTLGQLSASRNGSLVIGEHYFRDSTTPFFDFRPFGHPEWIAAKSEESVPAPANISIDGSVAWLKLGYKDGCGIKEVYRVVTAGGDPPSTCKGQPQTIQVDYAAEYWFYG